MRSRRIHAVCIAALVLASCSVFGMKRVPGDHHPDDYPNCTSTFTMPLGDAVLTVLSGATAVNLHSAASNPENEGKNFRVLAWSATGLAMVFLGSATYGAVQRNRCVRAKIQAGYGGEARPKINRAPAGSRAGKCRRDGSCDGDLICDAPMQTCIPILPDDKTLPSPNEP